MKPLQRTYSHTVRILCLLLALHLFNFSIDSRDRHPDFIPEDLSVNDIESIAEFMTEVVLGADNTFAEHDEADNEAGGSLDLYKWYVPSSVPVSCPVAAWSWTRTRYFIKDPAFFSEGVREVTSPPPQA